MPDASGNNRRGLRTRALHVGVESHVRLRNLLGSLAFRRDFEDAFRRAETRGERKVIHARDEIGDASPAEGEQGQKAVAQITLKVRVDALVAPLELGFR